MRGEAGRTARAGGRQGRQAARPVDNLEAIALLNEALREIGSHRELDRSYAPELAFAESRITIAVRLLTGDKPVAAA